MKLLEKKLEGSQNELEFLANNTEIQNIDRVGFLLR